MKKKTWKYEKKSPYYKDYSKCPIIHKKEKKMLLRNITWSYQLGFVSCKVNNDFESKTSNFNHWLKNLEMFNIVYIWMHNKS